MKMYRIITSLFLGLFSLLTLQAQFASADKVVVKDGSSIGVAGTDFVTDNVTMQGNSYLDLTDALLGEGKDAQIAHVRLYGYNTLEGGHVKNIYCKEGVTDLTGDMQVDGVLEETSGATLRSEDDHYLFKEVSLTPAAFVETGFGFTLKGEKAGSQEVRLYLNPRERQGKQSAARVLGLTELVALAGSTVTVRNDLLGGIAKPHLYYSVYGLDSWHPADESTYTPGSTFGSSSVPAHLAATAMPLVAGLAVFSEPEFYAPVAITPNGDGINDNFEISGETDRSLSRLTVFDKQGKVVYDKAPYFNEFDGAGLPAGTYYYVYYSDKGKAPRKRSTLTILR